jgi:two-component system NarL family sensor kinase
VFTPAIDLRESEQFYTPCHPEKIGPEKMMKAQKAHIDGSHLDGSHRIPGRKWPRVASQEACDKLYWIHAPEFLFGMRVSHTGRFVYESINPAFEWLLGTSSEDIRDKAVSDCMSAEDAKSICASCEACLADGEPVRYRHRLALGGPPRDFETTVTPVRDPASGSIVRLVGSHRTMKEGRDAVGVAARPASADLGARLLSLQEGVQQRIASDLHDSTCQHLIAASLNIMRMKCAINDTGNADAAERLCDDVDASIDQALREIRAFTYLLHPQNLLADGLKITIQQFVDGFSARTSLKVDLEIAPEVDGLSYEGQRSVLRVIQEALMNVFRHAKATEVKIALEAMGTHFKLRVSDNGRGMLIGQARSGPKALSFGVGIPAMRARLQQMGGALEIRSSSARERRGTTLCAVIPHSLPRKGTRCAAH